MTSRRRIVSRLKPKTIYGKAAMACLVYYLVLALLFFLNPLLFMNPLILPITGGVAFLAIVAGIMGSWREVDDAKTVPIIVLFFSIPVLCTTIYLQVYWTFGG
ncbi:hypothetical protein NLX67_00890 [Domibacillus sp. A3M-37]|uniref:hypothetical protein n=1 Tax=Domibacillus sp. A3M-37 TaxID=2962037 RepID=UPI0020B77ED9|nr:hypothetical protein [Domibacillus sp. A3M-37]MCP3760950.1 hypothetical protein [Domibacillus sp. A3M-37]